MTAPTGYEIGTTLGGIALLSSLSPKVTDPESNFSDYQNTVTLGNGVIRGMGYPSATWHYGFLQSAEYDKLKTFCGGISAEMYIATVNNDGDFKRYLGVMIMPTTFVIRNGRYMDVTINFTHLVLQS